MPDQTLNSLDVRQQRLVENARRAADSGDWEYALTACAEVLAAVPGCLPVRRLQRVVAKQKFTHAGGWLSKALSGITAWPTSLSGGKSPAEQLQQADKILAKDPYSITGLQLLAIAARHHGWPELMAFACEAIREIEPDNRDNLLALGEAWLMAEKPEAALRAADAILALNSVDDEAQALMRKASIAHTTKQGQWEAAGDFRAKLKVGSRGNTPPSIRQPSPGNPTADAG